MIGVAIHDAGERAHQPFLGEPERGADRRPVVAAIEQHPHRQSRRLPIGVEAVGEREMQRQWRQEGTRCTRTAIALDRVGFDQLELGERGVEMILAAAASFTGGIHPQ